jgi:hypothetical protein
LLSKNIERKREGYKGAPQITTSKPKSTREHTTRETSNYLVRKLKMTFLNLRQP